MLIRREQGFQGSSDIFPARSGHLVRGATRASHHFDSLGLDLGPAYILVEVDTDPRIRHSESTSLRHMRRMRLIYFMHHESTVRFMSSFGYNAKHE
jgi:hypothetical protein